MAKWNFVLVYFSISFKMASSLQAFLDFSARSFAFSSCSVMGESRGF